MMGFIALLLSLISSVFAVVSCCVVRKMCEDAEAALSEAVESLSRSGISIWGASAKKDSLIPSRTLCGHSITKWGIC